MIFWEKGRAHRPRATQTRCVILTFAGRAMIRSYPRSSAECFLFCDILFLVLECQI